MVVGAVSCIRHRHTSEVEMGQECNSHGALNVSRKDSMCRQGAKVSQRSARSAAGAQSPEAARRAACGAQSCPAPSAWLWRLQTPAAHCAAPRPATQTVQAHAGRHVRLMPLGGYRAHMLQPILSSCTLPRASRPGAKGLNSMLNRVDNFMRAIHPFAEGLQWR